MATVTQIQLCVAMSLGADEGTRVVNSVTYILQ